MKKRMQAVYEMWGFTVNNNRVYCSQCQAMRINTILTHENGCPNEKYECHGCGNIIPRNQKYCADCQ